MPFFSRFMLTSSRDKDGCTPNVRVPMVFIVLSRDSLGIITYKYPLYRAYIGQILEISLDFP